MKETGPSVPARGKLERYCSQENELYRVFQPIIGSAAVALYCNLTSMAFGHDPKFLFSRRSLAERAHMSRATVARELAVLEWIGMVRLRTRGGNLESEGDLVELKALARSLGAVPCKRAMSLILPLDKTESLKSEIAELRRRLQGKTQKEDSSRTTVSVATPESQRDASGSPERHQRRAGETQNGVQQIKENRRQENNPTPTPSLCGEASENKDVLYEGKAEWSLKRARDLFCGVMDDLKDHLVNLRPPRAHLDDGYEDWQRFGFESLGVTEVGESGGNLRLALCADDPTMTRAGLEKYRKTWHAYLDRWFGCQPEIKLEPVRPEGIGGQNL